MKIFVPGPARADSFTHNVAYTLQEMGHEVQTDSQAEFRMQTSVMVRGLNEFLGRAWKQWRLRGDRQVVATAREFKPDLTVMCTLTYEPDTVDEIRRVSGGRVVLWYADTPANLPRDHVVSGEYDAVFAKDPDFTKDLRRFLGIEAYHLVEACNPAWHRPVAGRRGKAVVLAGTSYGYRNAVIERLLEAGMSIRIYGPAPSRWVPAKVAAVHTGRFLDQEIKATVFGESMACLNTFAPSEGRNNINCRVFEACACGAALVTEQRDAIGRYFQDGQEYLGYENLDECLYHLRNLENDASGARTMRERAVVRAHGEHTYRHRLEEMLAILDMGSKAPRGC